MHKTFHNELYETWNETENTQYTIPYQYCWKMIHEDDSIVFNLKINTASKKDIRDKKYPNEKLNGHRKHKYSTNKPSYI